MKLVMLTFLSKSLWMNLFTRLTLSVQFAITHLRSVEIEKKTMKERQRIFIITAWQVLSSRHPPPRFRPHSFDCCLVKIIVYCRVIKPQTDSLLIDACCYRLRTQYQRNVMFSQVSAFLSVHMGVKGYPDLWFQVPSPISGPMSFPGGWGYPRIWSQVLCGDVGYPRPGPGQGGYPSGARSVVPPPFQPGPDRGTSSPAAHNMDGYAALSTPFVATQEDYSCLPIQFKRSFNLHDNSMTFTITQNQSKSLFLSRYFIDLVSQDDHSNWF